jgi:hypothetical protein
LIKVPRDREGAIGRGVGIDFGAAIVVHPPKKDANVRGNLLLKIDADTHLDVGCPPPTKIRGATVLRIVIKTGTGGRVIFLGIGLTSFPA